MAQEWKLSDRWMSAVWALVSAELAGRQIETNQQGAEEITACVAKSVAMVLATRANLRAKEIYIALEDEDGRGYRAQLTMKDGDLVLVFPEEATIDEEPYGVLIPFPDRD